MQEREVYIDEDGHDNEDVEPVLPGTDKPLHTSLHAYCKSTLS